VYSITPITWLSTVRLFHSTYWEIKLYEKDKFKKSRMHYKALIDGGFNGGNRKGHWTIIAPVEEHFMTQETMPHKPEIKIQITW